MLVKKFFWWSFLLLAIIFFSGCSQKGSLAGNQLITDGGYKEPSSINGLYATHNPTPQEILNENPDADFFLYKDAVAINAEHIEWVKNLKLTNGEMIGEIVYKYSKGVKFKQGMATKLSLGSKVYRAKERGEVLLVKVVGKYIRYLLALEG